MEEPVIAMVSDYIPRRCGIATFTHDLCQALAAHTGNDQSVMVAAINDSAEGYPYPDRVRFEIRQAVLADYRLAAEFLNIQNISAVCLQHEYGIFGGSCGSHILAMLRRLRRPLVSTFHTVLKEPDDQQRMVLSEVARLSSGVVVLSQAARDMLQHIYGVPGDKITMIHHGIPDVPFIDPTFHKDQFGVEGRKVLLTFGLLSPGKGIETAIEALPAVVRQHPEIIYILLGATHPHVRRESGEEYRNSLERRVIELGLADHVMFVNRFVTLAELCDYLGAADLYITPYLNEAQIVSGTLAYALGAGKAVISTPYWYAQEMLADGRGVLVPFRDSGTLAQQIVYLLDNETQRHAMRKRAYNFGRQMLWSEVARQYMDAFRAATDAWVSQRRRLVAAHPPGHLGGQPELPELDLRHLRTITDDTGLIQHCRYTIPDRLHGYCTDDNARALIVTIMSWEQTHDETILPLMRTYLAFINHALDTTTGRFRNFMKYDRTWAEDIGSEDAHSRALWGLGMAVSLAPYESMIALATWLFKTAMPIVESFTSPRAWAFAIVGMHAYLRRFTGDSEVRRCRERLSDRLLRQFHDNMTDDWPWCEDVLTYSNAKLPHALLMSGKWLQRNDMIEMGKRALDWLIRIQTGEQGLLIMIGTNGWHRRNSREPARFDQQPIEAHALIDACIEAYHVTREDRWVQAAYQAFNWFLGDNTLRAPLYDFTTGGCRDGLHADRVNENQGAESTVAWLQSLLLLQELQAELTLQETPDAPVPERPVPRPIGPGRALGARQGD